MATESKARSSSDEAILRERERSNQAVFRLLASWCEPGEEQEQQEQQETLDELKCAARCGAVTLRPRRHHPRVPRM